MSARKFLPSWLFTQAGLVIVLVLVLAGFVLRNYGIPWISKSLRPASRAAVVPEVERADVGKIAFAEFKRYLDVRESIELTIVDTTVQFEIEALPPGIKSGERTFLVTARQAHFSGTDIEALVRAGLSPIPSDHDPHHAPRWRGWSVSTNRADRTWKVDLYGLSGDGRVRLSIDEASAFVNVHLPRVIPIWRYTTYADRRSGFVTVGGHDLRVGEMVAPDLAADLCGFKVHSVSNRSVWFEVVYSEPNPALSRRLWPDLRIDYAELDSGQSYSRVVFESGHAMVAGDMAVFDEQGDALKLDSDAFLSDRAVRLRYLDRHGALVADMIVVTFGQ